MSRPCTRKRERRRLAVPAFLIVLALLRTSVAAGQTLDAGDVLWGEVDVPGGVAAARAAAGLGSDGRLDATFLLDFARRYADGGADTAVARLDRHLRAVATATTPAPHSALPLPLPEFWRREVFVSERLPVAAIFAQRPALLTYYGMMALDDASLAAFAEMPTLPRWLVTENAASAAFATSARSIRISSGTVQVPGGDQAKDSWASLVGQTPDAVEPFLQQLLTRDRGRLAWFYDAVGTLTPDRQRFVLGAHLPDEQRRAFLRAIYQTFTSVAPSWRVEVRPFFRPDFDGQVALLALDVRSDGSVGPDWWPSLLSRITRTQSWPVADGRSADLPPTSADAVRIFEWVFAEPADARRRFDTLRFAQRLFAAAPRDMAPQIELALRGMLEMPALLLSVERMNVRDPAVFAAVASAAHAATAEGGSNLAAIARWQAALALLEQAQRRVAWPGERIAPLLQSWANAAPVRAARPDRHVTSWVFETLAPALLAGRASGEDFEASFIRAATKTPAASVPFEWEGLSYATDASDATFKSAVALRNARNRLDLQHLRDLTASHRLLLAAPVSRASVEDALANLQSTGAAVAALPDSGGIDPRLLRRFDAAVNNLGQQLRQSGLDRAPVRPEPAIADLIDAITDAVLPPLVYALALAPTSEPALYPEVWMRHGLRQTARPDDGIDRPWQETAWRHPRNETASGGTQLIGSFLGVDVALAGSQLLRVVSGVPPLPQVIDAADRSGLVETLVFARAHAMDAQAAQLVATLARNRLVVRGWRDQSPVRQDLAARLIRAGVDPWRANAVSWAVHSGNPDVLDMLSASEILGLDASTHDTPPLWSGSRRPVDGCLCLADGRLQPQELLRGRRLGVQAFRPLDVTLRLAELVAELKLDLSIVPALLPMAIQDWLDRSEPIWVDDADAFGIWPRTLTVGRIEEYLMELVSTGRLSAPVQSEEGLP